jgi:Tol biopolymer transport system component
MASGKTIRLATFPDAVGTPFLNADGSQIIYSGREGESRPLFALSTAGGLGVRVTDKNNGHSSWTPSGRIVHYRKKEGSLANGAVAVIDPKTHDDRQLLEPDMPIYQIRFSPDEKTICFMHLTSSQTSQIAVAPATASWPIPKSQWIAVTDGTQWDDKSTWSPDGGLVYFTSERDGYRCLWARRIDPRNHQPAGDAFAVKHLHSSRRSMTNVGLSPLEIGIAPDRIVFVQGEVTGNVWLVKLP